GCGDGNCYPYLPRPGADFLGCDSRRKTLALDPRPKDLAPPAGSTCDPHGVCPARSLKRTPSPLPFSVSIGVMARTKISTPLPRAGNGAWQFVQKWSSNSEHGGAKWSLKTVLSESAGLYGQGTSEGRSGVPLSRLAPIGASAPSLTGPGSRIMACRAAAAN